MGGDLPDAVERTVVKATRAVRLRLETDTDMLNRARDNAVGDTRECARKVILSIA